MPREFQFNEQLAEKMKTWMATSDPTVRAAQIKEIIALAKTVDIENNRPAFAHDVDYGESERVDADFMPVAAEACNILREQHEATERDTIIADEDKPAHSARIRQLARASLACVRCMNTIFAQRRALAIRNAEAFQMRVLFWMRRVWGHRFEEIGMNGKERQLRFLEEALETTQAGGLTREDVISVLNYTYNRPVGHLPQEVGGVYITLSALCTQAGIDMVAEGEKELERIHQPEVMERIRAKHDLPPGEGPPRGFPVDYPLTQRRDIQEVELKAANFAIAKQIKIKSQSAMDLDVYVEGRHVHIDARVFEGEPINDRHVWQKIIAGASQAMADAYRGR